MTQYMVRGSNVFIGNELDMQVEKVLPVGTYNVSFDAMNNKFFLSRIPNFELPKKLYGNAATMADRFLTTFEDRPATTGILLAGDKGSGKSLTMKATSVKGLEQGVATLVVSSPYCGETFNQFIQAITEPCIIIFDEFEKVYDDAQQEALLTLLDGTFTTKKMVIMTCNDMHKINNHMTNRPGRLYYYLKYTGLTSDFIIDYCKDNLSEKNMNKIDSICKLSGLFSSFNFDMLKAICEELNRYNETVHEAVHILNIQIDQYRINYEIKLFNNSDGSVIPSYWPTNLNNPLQVDTLDFEIYYKKIDNEGNEEDAEESFSLPVNNENTKVKSDLSEIVLRNDKYRVVMTKKVIAPFDYSSIYG